MSKDFDPFESSKPAPRTKSSLVDDIFEDKNNSPFTSYAGKFSIDAQYIQTYQDWLETNRSKSKKQEMPNSGNPKLCHLLSLFGMNETSTPEEIKKAYIQKVKAIHPDMFPGQEKHYNEVLAVVNDAYDQIKKIMGLK